MTPSRPSEISQAAPGSFLIAIDAGFAVVDATVLTKGQPSFKQIKGDQEGERVAATDVVLTLAKGSRRSIRRTGSAALLGVLEAAIKDENGPPSTTGHLFGIAAAARLRIGESPLSFDEVAQLLDANFEQISGVWRLRTDASVAA